MRDLLDQLITAAQALRLELDKLGPIQEAHAKATAELKDTTTALDLAKRTLGDAKSGLTAAQMRNVREYEEAVFERRKELEGLLEQIEQARDKLRELTVHVANAHAQHGEIVASIESLKKRHFGG